jgi:hypothetical protein
MRPLFFVIRILGNELPPRDLPGSRLVVLEQLLREPELGGVTKYWIINRVWNPELVAAYCKLLAPGYRGRLRELVFREDPYFKAKGRDDRLLYCPGINHARNEGLRIAFDEHGAQFAAVLDGDCGFTWDLWEEVMAEIVSDHVDGKGKLAYSLPMLRISHASWNAALAGVPVPTAELDEPQLIITRHGWNLGIRYDESYHFGHLDKIELLIRLGHDFNSHRQLRLLHENMCRSIARCYHIHTGNDAVEADYHWRGEVREMSLARLHEDITHHYRG